MAETKPQRGFLVVQPGGAAEGRVSFAFFQEKAAAESDAIERVKEGSSCLGSAPKAYVIEATEYRDSQAR